MIDGRTLAVLLVLLLVSVAARGTSLFLLTLALLVAGGLSAIWERYCLIGVEYRRRFSRQRVAFAEEIDVEVEVVNRKVLPLSWLETEDEMPEGLGPLKGRTIPCSKPGRLALVGFLALRPFERVRRRHSIRCTARGEHQFGPVLLRSGDLFGFGVRESILKDVDRVVVYPRVVPVVAPGLPARHPLGDLPVRSWLFEDVARPAGVREHRPGDGLRRIHWPATARMQQLQSRAYEATTSHKLAILLNLDATEGGDSQQRYDSDVLEMGIVVAASIANWGHERGYQVGLYTNGTHRGSTGAVILDPGRGVHQMERILLALARLEPIPVKPYREMLLEDARRLPLGCTAIMVSASMDEPIAAALSALPCRGHAAVAILSGRNESVAAVNGIPVYRVGPPESWRDIEALRLAGCLPGARPAATQTGRWIE